MSTVRVRYRDQHGIVVESVTLPPAEGPNFSVQLNVTGETMKDGMKAGDIFIGYDRSTNEPMREKEARMDKSETWKCTSCGSSRLDGESLCAGTGQPHPIDRDVWPEFYATSEVAAVRDKHCIGFSADDPLTAIDKALVARTENALRDFEGRNDSDTAEALRLLDDDRRAFADGSCRETRVDAVRRMRGGWPAAERISAENAKLCEEHAEYVREAEIGTARRNAIARDAFDEGHAARAFVATVASLPCVHGRRHEDGPCPTYESTCPPCTARRIMEGEERTA